MQTLQNLIDSLSRRLKCAVSLDDRPLQMMFHSCVYGRLDEARIRRMLAPDRGPEPQVTEYIRSCVRPVAPILSPLRIPPNPGLGVESRLFMPIRLQDEQLGTLLVFDPEYAIGEAELPAIMKAATTAAQIIRYEQILWDPDRSREHDLLSAVLFGTSETSERAAREAHRTGLLDPGPVAVLAATPAETAASNRTLSDICEDVRASLAPGYALLAENAGEIDLLVSTSEPSIQRDGIRAVAARIATQVPDGMRIGIGQERLEIHEAQVSLQEARQALRVAGQWSFPPVVAWQDLGAMKLMLQVPQAWLDANPLVPELTALLTSQPVLCETLESYLRNAGHAQKTAAELFIHRATLHYRLRKIEELCRCNLDDGEDRLAMHMALKAALLTRSSL
ncbi:MAG: PucR family transcriptional regulator [Dehalococcoidia bacterium]